MANLVLNAAMVATGDEATRWVAYSGPYRTPAWGVLDPTGPPDRFVFDAGVPYFEVDERGSLVRHRLAEVEPGVFLADNGGTLDRRDPVPTWQGLRLVRVAVGPAPWQSGILGTLAAAWLVAAAVRGHQPPRVAFRLRPAALRLAPLAPDRRTHGAHTAVLTLGNAALVAWIPGLVDSGFLGWLEFPWPSVWRCTCRWR